MPSQPLTKSLNSFYFSFNPFMWFLRPKIFPYRWPYLCPYIIYPKICFISNHSPLIHSYFLYTKPSFHYSTDRLHALTALFHVTTSPWTNSHIPWRCPYSAYHLSKSNNQEQFNVYSFLRWFIEVFHVCYYRTDCLSAILHIFPRVWRHYDDVTSLRLHS